MVNGVPMRLFTKLKKYYRISFHGGTLDLDQNTRQISLSLDNWIELDYPVSLSHFATVVFATDAPYQQA